MALTAKRLKIGVVHSNSGPYHHGCKKIQPVPGPEGWSVTGMQNSGGNDRSPSHIGLSQPASKWQAKDGKPI
jgi:hypothetical protein